MFGFLEKGSWFGKMLGFGNSASGAGGNGDMSGAEVIIRPRLSPMVISALLRQDAMLQMAVEAMPEDIVRAWRERKSDQQSWTEIEERLKYKKTIEKALFWADAFGGALIIPRYDESAVSIRDMERPFRQPRAGALLGFKVYMPHQLKAHWESGERLEYQADNDLPMKFRIEDRNGTHVVIHHSWTIPVFGQFKSDYHECRQDYVDSCDHMFGESRVDLMYDGLMRMNIALQNTSHMLAKANLDTLKIQGLAQELAGCTSTEQMIEQIQGAVIRAGAAVQGASIYQPVVIDAEEDLERNGLGSGSSSVNKMTELMVSAYVAITKIPRTRLMGEQATGLGNGDDGSLKHYYDRCDSIREKRATDPLRAMDALVEADQDLTDGDWEYAKLWHLSDKDQAEVEKTRAETDKIYLDVEGFDMQGQVRQRLVANRTYEGDGDD